MALSQLQTKRNDGVEYIDFRPSLYYNKYRYRARFYCDGITLAWFTRSLDEIESKIQTYKKRYDGCNATHIFNFCNWKENNKQNKTALVRIEGRCASAFSNDLEYLKTLETLGCPVDYTEVDTNVVSGVRYFVREPKHKYRIYLKSRRISEEFREKLKSFIKRYENTQTVVEPSSSLSRWLRDDSKHPVGSWIYIYHKNYTSGTHFIDYNDESIITIFSIMFSGMISKSYKLEKRPDSL